jgi:hypothetical protein
MLIGDVTGKVLDLFVRVAIVLFVRGHGTAAFHNLV